MVDLSERAWITSLSQHRLGCINVAFTKLDRNFSSRQLEMAGMNDLSQPGDMTEQNAGLLAWEIALEAQSCAYLALVLQELAQILSEQPITCPELIFSQLLGSHATFRALVEHMTVSYSESIDNGSDHSLPTLSSRMVGEIRAMLDQDLATTKGGSTTSFVRAMTKRFAAVGGMR
jgi:hypothetical protein